MAKYSIHAGHNFHVTGAHGFIKEEVVDRQIKDAAIKYLRAAGQTVYDDTDEDGRTQNQNLANIVRKVNSHSGVELAVSIHLNAGKGTGIEVYQYNNKTDAVAQRILNNVCKATGLHGHGVGVKKNPGLYVLRNTKPSAILVECGFVDTDHDADVVSERTDAVGKAIAEGIIGKSVAAPKPPASKPASKPASGHLYRVRKSAGDAKSQIGAFKDKGNAINLAKKHSGYEVYDESGNKVYGASKSASKPQASSQSIVPYPGHLIKVGSRGKDVQRVQRAVSVTPDGIYGPATKKAVQAYQKRHGLAADGIVGEKTWKVMF